MWEKSLYKVSSATPSLPRIQCIYLSTIEKTEFRSGRQWDTVLQVEHHPLKDKPKHAYIPPQGRDTPELPNLLISALCSSIIFSLITSLVSELLWRDSFKTLQNSWLFGKKTQTTRCFKEHKTRRTKEETEFIIHLFGCSSKLYQT